MDELETDILEKLADCWNMFLDLEQIHPDHIDDFRGGIHALQYMIMARPEIRKQRHDLTKEPKTFIQWKGTDVCMDFWCDCGTNNHYDGYFAYQIRCAGCNAVFELGHSVSVKLVDPLEYKDPLEPNYVQDNES